MVVILKYSHFIKAILCLPILLGLSVTSFSTISISAQQANSSAPYLYYYSDFVHGVVVERADGTDSRIIGSNVMSQDLFVAQLAWSASNEWLAWRGEFSEFTGTDGRLAEQLVISSRNGVQIIDSDSFLPALATGESATIRFAWMPRHDGLLVERVVGSNDGKTSRLQLYVIDLTPHKITATYETTLMTDENFDDIIWSPDEKYAIVSSATEMFTLWMDGRVTQTSIVNDVSCNPSNIWLPSRPDEPFVAQRGDQLIITNSTTDPSVIIKAPTEPIASIDWSPNAKWALLNPCAGTGPIKLLSMRDLTLTSLPAQFEPSRQPYDIQTWSPDSTRVVFVNSTDQIQVLDIPSMTVISDRRAQIVFEKNSFDDIALVRWSGPDQVYWGTTSGRIFRYNLVSRAVDSISNYQGLFAVSPDDRYLATDCALNELARVYGSFRTCITDITTGQTSLIMPSNNVGSILYTDPFRWHSSGNWLITALGAQTAPVYEISVGNTDGTVQRQITECVLTFCADWLPDPSQELPLMHQRGSVLGQPDQTLFGPVGSLNSVAWSPDGRQIASGSQDGTIHLWNAQTGQTERLFGKIGGSSVDQIAWNADGTHISAWLDDKASTIQIWNVSTGEMATAPDPGFDHLSVSPDRKTKAVINKDNLIDLLDMTTGKLKTTLQGNGVLAWSHDSQQLFTWFTTYGLGLDNSGGFIITKIRVWSTRTGELIRELVPPAYESIDLGSASVSPDNNLFAVTTFEDTTVWNVMTRQVVIHVYQGGIVSPLLGNTQVDWSPDSRKLALTASYSVQIWNISIPSSEF